MEKYNNIAAINITKFDPIIQVKRIYYPSFALLGSVRKGNTFPSHHFLNGEYLASYAKIWHTLKAMHLNVLSPFFLFNLHG